MTTLLLLVVLFYCVLVPYLEAKIPVAGVPMAPRNHWLYGHTRQTHGRDSFPESFLDVFCRHADEHGRTGFWLVHHPCVSLMHIEDARHVLKVEYQRTRVPIVSHYIAKVIGPKNLLFLNGREWKQHRDAVTRTFVHSFLVQSQQDVGHVAQDLIKTLHTRIAAHQQAQTSSSNNIPYELDVIPVMKMVTSDVIGKAAFSVDFHCCQTLTSSSIVGAFEYLMNDMTARAEHPLLPWNYCFSLPLEKNRRLDEQVTILRDFIENLLHEARIKMKKLDNNLSPKNQDAAVKISLMDRLVVAHDSSHTTTDDDGTSSSYAADQVLIDVVSTLLIASYDTTSTTLAFALYLLALHPDIQETCVEEVHLVQKESGTDTITSPDDLVYCTALIQETLRIYPPAAQVARSLTKPITLHDGFVVPPGARCAVPIFAIHRDEQYFPRPLECRPDRWCQRVNDNNNTRWVERNYHEEQVKECRSSIPAGNPDAWIPFSVGARACPGAKFALQEAVIVLANLVQHFQVTPQPGYKLKLNLKSVLPYPVGGMPLRMEPREPLSNNKATNP